MLAYKNKKYDEARARMMPSEREEYDKLNFRFHL